MGKTIRMIMALLAFAGSANAEILSGGAQVIDGDSFSIDGREVRLHGLDAPELGQTCQRDDGTTWPCGQAARAALAALVDGTKVICQRAVVHSRYVGKCRVGDIQINSWVLGNGWAVIDRRGSHRYVGFESRARKRQLNLWSGKFERPWKWRDHAAKNKGANGVSFLFFDVSTVDQ